MIKNTLLEAFFMNTFNKCTFDNYYAIINLYFDIS